MRSLEARLRASTDFGATVKKIESRMLAAMTTAACGCPLELTVATVAFRCLLTNSMTCCAVHDSSPNNERVNSLALVSDAAIASEMPPTTSTVLV